MRITCDICGKPCRGQGTQGQGRNQRPATSTPTPRPTTPFISNRHHGLVPHSVRSAHIHQSARNPRIRHAARPPTGTTASHPHHSRAQNADHLAQNTPHSLNFTEVVCTLGASIPNTANMETAARPTGIAAVSVGGGAWPNIGNDAPSEARGADGERAGRSASITTTPPAWRAPEGPEGLAGLRGAAPNEVRP